MWGRRSGSSIRVNLVGFHSGQIKFLFVNFGQVVAEEFGHTKSANFFGSKNLCHLLVGGEILFVFRILQIVLFHISPKFFDALSTTGLKS